MNNNRYLSYLLLIILMHFSFESFCQFGEKQVIHEDEEEVNENYIYRGSFDFDNDSVNELWYERKGTATTHVFFKMVGDKHEVIEIETLSKHLDINEKSVFEVIDFDGNGLMDIFYLYDEKLYLIKNQPEFQFSTPIEIPFSNMGSNFLFVDVDLDGFTDIVFSTESDNSIAWIKNNGNSEYTLGDPLGEFNEGFGKILSADINQDGFDDLIVQTNSAKIDIYLWSSNSYEFAYSIDLNGNNISQVLISDMNKDDYPDLVLLLNNDEQLVYYYENRDGRIEEGIEVYSNQFITQISTINIDNDQDIDIALEVFEDLTNGENFSGILLIENLGNNIFEANPFHWFYALDFTDVNADGKADVILTDELVWVELIDHEKKHFLYHSLIDESSLGRVHEIEVVKVNNETKIISTFEKNLTFFSNIITDPKRKNIKITSNYPYESGLLDAFTENQKTFLTFSYEVELSTDGDRGYPTELLEYNPEHDGFLIQSEFMLETYGLQKIHSNLLNDDSSYDLVLSNGSSNDSDIYEKYEAGFQLAATSDFVYDVINRTEDQQSRLLSKDGIYTYADGALSLVSTVGGNKFIDLDGDGDQDVLTVKKVNSFEFTESYWYENTGNNEYSEKKLLTLEAENYYYGNSYLLVDIDNDKDADYVFSSSEGLFWQENLDSKGAFSEKKLIESITPTVIKSADMDNDGDQDLIVGGEGYIYWYENKTLDSNAPSLALSFSTTEALQEDVVEIPIKAGDYKGLQSLSFSIQWDNEIAAFEEVTQFSLEGMSQGSFITDEATEGRIGFNWTLEGGTDVSDDKTLFVLKLKLNGDETQSTDLEISNEPVSIQARNTSGQIISIESTAGTITIQESVAPNDITLSNTEIEENQPAGTLIANLFSKDEDNTEGFSYTFAEGEGDEDNELFSIENTNQLLSADVFDFEEKETYSIRIQTTDSRGKSFQKAFAISITDIDEITNTAPTGIALSATSIDEHLDAGTLIGTLSTTDEDEDDEHTYSLVEGEGSSGNDFFTIRNNELLSLEQFDFEEQASYTIRIQTDDGKDGRFSRSFEITINDVEEVINQDPTDIAISNQSIKENEAGGMVVGELSTADPDADDVHNYSLVSGEGSDGNDFFVIKDNHLISLVSFDYEQRTQTSVRIETDDDKGGTFQKSFVIFIEDVADDTNQAPTEISLSNATVNENAPVNTLVGDLSATDADDTDFTFSLVEGTGNANNNSFNIEGNQLLTAESFDYELKDRYTIRIQADDGKGGTFAKQFWISVNDLEDNVNRFPTDISLSNQSIEENQTIGTLIGEFSTDDQDEEDSHSYKLLESDDYTFFAIEGNELLSNAIFDYEIRNTLVIKVQTDDGRGGTYTKFFVINVVDIENEAPAEISLSNASIEENKSIGSLVGNLSVAGTGTYAFELVSGDGDDNNGLFLIADDELLSDEVFDYEARDTYTIRVRATDGEGESIEKTFTISITDVNDNMVPEVVNFIADQNLVIGEEFSFTIPANTFADQDATDELSYSATLGNGEPLPEWLAFDAETSTLSGTPEANGNVTIRIIANDLQGATSSDEFILIIEGVTAIGEELSQLYKIYPNPTANYLQIEKQDKGNLIKYCRIIDHTGRIVKEWEIRTITDLQIDMNALRSGVYLLELVSTNETLRTQVLKK